MLAAVVVHVAGGALALVAGYTALAVRKGERLHRAAGRVFFAAMLAMAGVAAVLAVLGAQKLNAIAAIFTLYLVATAWTTVRREEGAVGRLEALAPLVLLGLVAAGLTFGWQAASRPGGLPDGDPSSGSSPTLYFAFAALAAFAAVMDLRVLARRGLRGADRIARHLWRMCLALGIAAGSFFLGQADEIPQALHGPHLVLLSLAPLAALIFWLARVRLAAWRGRSGPVLESAA